MSAKLFIHHRQSIRLPGADYSVPGFYFVTICTKNRESLFGEIINDEMVLNEFGKIAQKEWNNTSKIRPGIIIDEFVIMPNHMHGIILITNKNLNGITTGPHAVGAHSCAPLPQPDEQRIFYRQPRSIGSMIAGLKSITTKQINIMREFLEGGSVWQRNYFEHIIKNDASLNRIRQYIQGNPFNWQTDLENNKYKHLLNDKERTKQIKTHYADLFI